VRADRTYFEDVAVGETVVTPGLTVTEAHVSLFRGLTGEPGEDPRGVPELLPLALCTGLGWRVPRPPLAVRAFLSLEWEILAPLRVGDTLRSTSRTVARRSLREGGVIVEDHQVVDQRGTVVQRGRFTFLVDRRPRAAEPSALKEDVS
jgi:acyl dehydratase